MKKIVETILLFFFLIGCGNKQITTPTPLITSPIIIETTGLKATSDIIYTSNKFTNNNDKIDLSKSCTKNNTIKKESKDTVKILKNSITIPDVCNNAEITIGSTQESIDNYDICLMTEAAASFGQGKPILLGGHNTKSLKFLYRAKTSKIIDVTYLGVKYQYEVIYSNECINDGYRLFDIKTGANMLDYNLDQEAIYIYTCYGNNNWLVKAIRI